MSIPAGGSATFHGILYQMLWSLLEAFTLQIEDCDSDSTGESVTQAFLVLEPQGGGGDLLVQDRDAEIVQQLKARSDGGAWSLREIVSDVLPDLYRAVKLGRAQRFVFITEGHMGDWKQVHDFFQSLTKKPTPEEGQNVLPLLDNSRQVSFRGSLAAKEDANSDLTEKDANSGSTEKDANSDLGEEALFAQIATILRKKQPARDEDVRLTHRKLWKLLANLEFQWEQATNPLRDQLQQRLRAVVDDADLIEMTLNALLASLALRASHGNAHIRTAEFLNENGLRALPLTSWHRLVTRSSAALEARLPLFRYQPEEDIRVPLLAEALQPWTQGDARILILSGESGQGKTWRLIQLARSFVQTTPTVAFEAKGDGDRDRDEAARLFWQVIAGHGSAGDLDVIARRVEETVPMQIGRWLFVFLDNVRTISEAKELYHAFRAVPGVRLAFTAPAEVADQVAGTYGTDVHVIPVRNFTETELREYIAGGDAQVWHSIPGDIRLIIRFPLLADIYRQLNPDGKQTANTEYQLYARYHQQRLVQPLKQSFPGAFVALRRAALAVWAGEQYPWSLEQFEEFGMIDSGLLNFLIEIGWLRRDEQDNYQVWHDRLLNWQVAEAVCYQLERRQLTGTTFGGQWKSVLHQSQMSSESQRLGYVPMDVIWLLTQCHTPTADAALDAILQQVDGDFRTDPFLYEHLLPTVGIDIIPALYRRLETLSEPSRDVNYIAAGLEKLDAAAVSPGAIRLLRSEERFLRRSGIGILVKRPSLKALDLLWSRYAAMLKSTALPNSDLPNSDRDDLWERLSLYPALKACVPLDQDWLEGKILMNPPAVGELAGTQADLLCVVPEGRPLWLKLKNVLRQNVNGGGERHFANAAYHFRDAEEIEWLRLKVGAEENALGLCCLRALVRIAPAIALESLDKLSAAELASACSWTTHLLWACCLEETVQRIQDLMLDRVDITWDYARLFSGIRGAMTPAILDSLINALFPEDALFAEDALPPGMEQEGLDTLRLKFYQLGQISRLNLLDVLGQRAGTAWEDRLTRLLVEDVPQPKGWHDVMHRDAVRVLYKMGGRGFTRLVNHWLENGDVYARREAIDIAFKRPDAQTLRLLELLAAGPVEREEGEEAHPSHEAYMAQLALARAENWLSVVKTLVLWSKDSNRDVIFARWGAAPLSDLDMAPALTALQENPKHPGAIMALGFGQRIDYTERIVKILAEENPQEGPQNDSGVINACLWALTVLPRIPSSAVPPLSLCLSRLQSRWLVVPLLVRAGSPLAASTLMDFLKDELTAPFGPRDMSADDVVTHAASYLIHNPATRVEAEELCRRRISRDAEPDSLARHLINTFLDEDNYQAADDNQEADDYRETGDKYNSAGLLSGENAQSFFMENAFRADHGIHFAGEKARMIRGLSVLSAEDAYAAALQLLLNPEANDRDRVPQLLLEINRSRAISDLTRHLAAEKQSLLRQICGRALCGAGASDEMREQYLVSSDSAYRAAACFVLGFASPNAENETAVRKCLEDEDVHVFEEACRTLRRMNAAACIDELVTAYLSESDSERRWVLMDTALEGGDVFEVSWLRRMLHDAPQFIVDYVQEQVRKQRDKAKDRAKSEDWHNHVSS